MKMKAISLIVLVIFATMATLVALCSSNQMIGENVSVTESYNIVQIDSEDIVEPNGIAIDNPGMPG